MQSEYPPTAEGMCELQADFLRQLGQEEKRNPVIAGLEAWVFWNGGRTFEYTPLPDWQELMEPNMCFQNCTDLAISGDGLTYCEGYVMFNGFPLLIHHAWIVDEDGRLIDPTIPEDDDARKRSYFGIEIPTRILMRAINAGGTYGVLDKPEGRELIEQERTAA